MTAEHKFLRDPYSKAIVNADKEAYESYMRKKTKSQKMIQLEEKVDTLESKLDMILELLNKKDA